MTTKKKTPNGVIVLAIVGIAAVLAYAFLTMPDRRTDAERIGDAISELPNGLDRAVDQLGDRTPGERIGEAIKDMGDDAERKTQ